uniref:Uncharacterized protein n=1 Tax=Anguilla anguilla TaxID=7936 RepID=A0A0E9WB80_ANGAN
MSFSMMRRPERLQSSRQKMGKWKRTSCSMMEKPFQGRLISLSSRRVRGLSTRGSGLNLWVKLNCSMTRVTHTSL